VFELSGAQQEDAFRIAAIGAPVAALIYRQRVVAAAVGGYVVPTADNPDVIGGVNALRWMSTAFFLVCAALAFYIAFRRF